MAMLRKKRRRKEKINKKNKENEACGEDARSWLGAGDWEEEERAREE